MRNHHRALASLAALIAAGLLAISTPAAAGVAVGRQAPERRPEALTGSIIVRLRAEALAAPAAAAPDALAGRLAALAGAELDYVRAGSLPGMHLLRPPAPLPAAEVAALAARIAASPGVAYAEPERILTIARTPTDPLYATYGWHLQPLAGASYGADLPAAWDVTTGSDSVVAAVIDTGGLLAHEDLAGRAPAANPGYDMIASAAIANDGGGRDANPADPGDWVAASETDSPGDPLIVAGCSPGYTSDSSWHGSHVAGTIGASANNARGITGITWASKLLHMRALGKCGGSNLDIADAIRWAAGLPVSGLPLNPNPARVINMSLGGAGECDQTTQDAIDDARGLKQAVIVVAAGNEELDLDDAANATTPAMCAGVITVAASTRGGGRAWYSNYGGTVEIAAPGGASSAPGEGVVSAADLGAQGPEGDTYDSKIGTSMATPHVAGVVSLMLSANPALSPDQVLQILQQTATPFPLGSTCTTGTCGAGILNAGRAVEAAARLARTVGWRDAGQIVSEGAGLVNVPVRLSIPSNQTVTVPYTVSGTAGPADHALAAGSVSFAPGVSSAKISFTLADDAALEGDETIVVTLGAPAGSPSPATVAAPAAHTVTLRDNDAGLPATTLSLGAASADETPAEAALRFDVVRAGPAVAAGASYAVRVAGENGALLAEGEVALGAAETTRRVSVTLSRAQLGLAPALVVELSAPTGGATLGAQATAQLPLTGLSRLYLPLAVR